MTDVSSTSARSSSEWSEIISRQAELYIPIDISRDLRISPEIFFSEELGFKTTVS